MYCAIAAAIDVARLSALLFKADRAMPGCWPADVWESIIYADCDSTFAPTPVANGTKSLVTIKNLLYIKTPEILRTIKRPPGNPSASLQ
jgi:hypothetical protein